MDTSIPKLVSNSGSTVVRASRSWLVHSYAGFNMGKFVTFSEKLHFIWSDGHSIKGDNTTTNQAGFLGTI